MQHFYTLFHTFKKAFVFNIQTEKSNNNSAYQIFLENGPIAFLPVSENEFSMVISVRNKFNDSNIYCKENLTQYLNQITNGSFGEIDILGEVINFNLFGYNSDSYKHKNIVFVGDSAHSVHPLAGMGLNLGLSDIIEIQGLCAGTGQNVPGYATSKTFYDCLILG